MPSWRTTDHWLPFNSSTPDLISPPHLISSHLILNLFASLPPCFPSAERSQQFGHVAGRRHVAILKLPWPRFSLRVCLYACLALPCLACVALPSPRLALRYADVLPSDYILLLVVTRARSKEHTKPTARLQWSESQLATPDYFDTDGSLFSTLAS